MPTPSASTSPDDQFPGSLRTIVTLLLVIHLFLVGVSVGSNFAPADWQLQVLSNFRFYTRLLNFDLDLTPFQSVPFHLTHATEFDVDHRIEVLPEGESPESPESWLVLPSDDYRGSDAYQRYQRLAAQWANAAQTEGDPAIYAQSIGTHFARQRGIAPRQLRCRRHFLQSPDDVTQGTAARRNPDDPSYFASVYTANAIVSDTGFVEVVRVDEAGQVAQPVNNSPEQRDEQP